jgi:hypothetical protein
MAAVLFSPASADQRPTVTDPLLFEIPYVHMQTGQPATIDLVIERWSTDVERRSLAALVMSTTGDPQAQGKLQAALKGVTPQVGFLGWRFSSRWLVKYAHETRLPDGTRRIVIATEKNVPLFDAIAQAGAPTRGVHRRMEYGFHLLEVRFPAGSKKGKGQVAPGTAIAITDEEIDLDSRGHQPVQLMEITQLRPKTTT